MQLEKIEIKEHQMLHQNHITRHSKLVIAGTVLLRSVFDHILRRKNYKNSFKFFL
jgi:hypothetical protein